MKKFAFMLGILALLLASCTTVYLTTVPDGTSVIFPDGTTAVTPCKIQFGWLSSRTVSISHQGFLTESRTLTRNTPKVDMVMQRQIMIDSQPQGADVTIDGKHHGVTPCQAFIPATISTANITVSKQGFLPQTSAFDCNGKENSINFRLPQNGSGRTKVSIKYENTGFPVFSTDTISNHKLGSPAKDSAECVAVLNDRQFPLRLSPFGKEHKLLVSIAQRHSIANRYTSRFYSLDCATGEMTPILSGRYYELNGTIRENSLIYASFKTGRFDYWKHDLKKPDSSPTLLLTNRLIKMEADVSADDTHILFSAYTPDEPPIPNIWMFVPDSATSSEPYLLCEGSHPAWSPDAQHFIFQKNKPQRIAKADRDGSNIRILNDTTRDYSDIHPAWSPDGQSIVFASNRDNDTAEETDIWLMNANGDNARKITDSSSNDDFPVFSPDGKTVYFISNRNLQWGVWKIHIN